MRRANRQSALAVCCEHNRRMCGLFLWICHWIKSAYMSTALWKWKMQRHFWWMPRTIQFLHHVIQARFQKNWVSSLNFFEIWLVSRDARIVSSLAFTKNASAFSIFTKLLTYKLILSNDKSIEITRTSSDCVRSIPQALIVGLPSSFVYALINPGFTNRSEERRVGKEC